VRLAVLSDLHLDSYPDPEELLNAVIVSATEGGAEGFLLAGDVSGDYELTLQTLYRLDHAFDQGCFFVPGNHDIWNQNYRHLSSWDIYHRLLSYPKNLARGPFDLESGWKLVGDIGWYDYSFGSADFSREEFDRMEHRGRVWQDRVFALWGMPTADVHRHFLTKLQRQLVPGDAKRRVVMVTHVVPVREFTVPFRPHLWDYLNAFMGGVSYGELALRSGVDIAVSGHVHFRRQVLRGGTRFICNCLGYRYQWRSGRNPYVEVPGALTYLELD
jgi:putative phosphoesterase